MARVMVGAAIVAEVVGTMGLRAGVGPGRQWTVAVVITLAGGVTHA